MKIFVVGANGQIGRHLVQKLLNNDKFSVRAMIRDDQQAGFFSDLGAETAIVNIEGTVDEIAEAMRGCDAVVFTAGSGGHTGADKTLLVDLDGAVKTIEAAEQTGIDRFVMVSALQAHHRENWSQAIKPYYVAKHYADRILSSSKLNYTIIRPGGLLNESGTGKISIAESLHRGTIPREDVATTIVECLKQGNTYRKSFDLISGDQSIETAIGSL